MNALLSLNDDLSRQLERSIEWMAISKQVRGPDHKTTEEGELALEHAVSGN